MRLQPVLFGLVVLIVGLSVWSNTVHAQRCPMVPDVPDQPSLRVVVHVVSLNHTCARALNGTGKLLHYGVA